MRLTKRICLIILAVISVSLIDHISTVGNDPLDSLRDKLGLFDASPSDEKVKNAKQTTTSKPRRPYPKHYYRKDKIIERNKVSLMKANKDMDPETAEKGATKLYEVYMQRKKENNERVRKSNKEAKQFIQSVDKDLAKSMSYKSSRSKENWITRRIQRIKDENTDLTHSQAESQAHLQYHEKNQKDLQKKRDKYWRDKNKKANDNNKATQK